MIIAELIAFLVAGLPFLQDNIITHREGWRPRRPKRAFKQKNRAQKKEID
jgi:hypothetical protein